jgi:two-component system, sensor histidine kinase
VIERLSDRIARMTPALSALVGALGILAALAACLVLMRFNSSLIRSETEAVSARIVALVESEMATVAQMQRGVAAALGAADIADARSYQTLFDAMGLAERYPSLRAVAFAPRISGGEEAALQARAAEDDGRAALGYPAFAIQPPGSRETMFPAFFVFPIAGNARVPGFDVWANAERRAAAERAIVTRNPVASAPVVLSQDTQSGLQSVLAVLPVFARGELSGLVAMGLSPSQLIGPMLAAQFPNTRAIVRDIGAVEASAPAPVPAQAVLSVAGPAMPDGTAADAVRVRSIPILGRMWEIRVEHRVELPLVLRFAPLAALVGGFVMAVLIVLVLRVLGERQRALEKAVTERTSALQAALAAAATQTELAHQAAGAKDRFFANMSHELRTPLNAVVGYSEALKLGIAGALPVRATTYVGAIQSSANWLKRIVDDVLEMSRGGDAKLDIEPLSLLDVISEIASVLQAAAERRRVHLVFGAGLAQAPRVAGNLTALGRIVANLAENAFKFSPQGETVTIDAHADNAFVSLVVTDRGPGVPPAEREKVFLPFYQAERRVAGGGESGVGLGLAICLKLAHAMGATVDLADNPPQGTRARVTLRRAA